MIPGEEYWTGFLLTSKRIYNMGSGSWIIDPMEELSSLINSSTNENLGIVYTQNKFIVRQSTESHQILCQHSSKDHMNHLTMHRFVKI